MDTRSWCSGAGTLAAGADETQFALDALPDGCLTNVLEHLDIQSLLAMRGVSRRSQQLASQPALWRHLFHEELPYHASRLQQQRPPLSLWPAAYKRRRRTQRRWLAAKATCTELRAHTGPVFSVEHLSDPFSLGSVTISGGVFGYGETSELYQWNAGQAGLPLEWPAAAQLGGVIALSQRPGRRDIVIGGFAGCAQIVELVEADVEAMTRAQVSRLCASLLPDSWLTAPQEVLAERLMRHGRFYTARHTHTMCGHGGAIPGADACEELVATSGFDGCTHVWRPSDSPLAGGAAEGLPPQPHMEAPLATLIEPPDPALPQDADAPGGAPESKSVCSVVIAPDRRTLATGCNDHLVRLWDIEHRRVVSRLAGHGGWVWCLEPHPTLPATLISGATDGKVKMWDQRLRHEVANVQVGTMTSDPTGGAIAGLAIRPDGFLLTTGSFDTLVSIVDVRTWQLLHSLEGHGHRVTRVTATDDGIYSASFDSSLRYWSFDELHQPCAQPAAAARQEQQQQDR